MSITRINSLGITDGTIVNADINASAAIASTKLSGVTSEVKAWVNFNGTGTPAIRGSLNVSSITDNGTGDYTVNFTNALTDANYSVVASTSNIQATAASGSVNIFSSDAVNQQAPTTNNFRFVTPQYDWNALRDPQYVCVSVFR